MRGFEQHIKEFRARGVAIAAISVDSTDDLRKLRLSEGYSFLLLSDPKAEAIRRYGVVHQGAGEEGRDIARPAEFLVDRTGTIRWVNLTHDLRIRVRPETMLRMLDASELISPAP